MSGPAPATVPPTSGSPGPVVAVGGVAVVDGFLLMVERARPPAAGLWTVPGGRVEPGESVTAAVEREVGEETGLDVACGAFLGWAERRGDGFHFVILDFAVSLSGRPPPTAGDDAAAAAWVPLPEVADLPLVEGLHRFLVEHGVLR